MAPYCSINGKIRPMRQASVGLNDLALLRGYGIFDYFLFKYSRPLLIERYLRRFYRSAELMHLSPPLSMQALYQQILELIATNGQSQGSIRLVLTGGYTEDGYSPATPNLIILQHPYPNYPESYFTEGVGLISHDFQREWPEVKTINYLTGIKLLPEIKKAGALEVLYHRGGKVLESVRSNIFLVNDKEELITPDADILFGITRESVLKIAGGQLPIHQRPVSMEELMQARELFITGTNKSVMPVVRIGEQPIGDGKVGYWSRRLKAQLDEYREQYYKGAAV